MGKSNEFFKKAGEKARRKAEKGCSPAEHLAVFLGGENSMSPSCQAQSEGRCREGVDQTHKLVRQRESLISSRG